MTGPGGAELNWTRRTRLLSPRRGDAAFRARSAQAAPKARSCLSYSPECHFCGDTATVAPRAFVLASFISLVPPQAAGLVHCAARPLQTANATLVCCLVPFLSCQKKVCKKEALDAKIALTRRKTIRFVLRIFVTLQVKERPSGDRRIGFPERTINYTNRSVCAR